MNLIILVPRVAQNYIAQFPEVTHNAYEYFNYDNRVVEERVERHDQKAAYKGPENLTNNDYDSLVTYAKTLLNPILLKYGARVAHEDALNIAIRSFNNGLFDGKVKADRFAVLLNAMMGVIQPVQTTLPVMAAKKELKEEPKAVPMRVLKNLGVKVKDLPLEKQVKKQLRLVRHKGKPALVTKK